MARKRRLQNESEDLDRWIISYADFITLLFAFFVVMYAISSVNEGVYREVSSSLVAAFKNQPKSLEPIQVGEISRTQKKNVIDTPMKHAESAEKQIKQSKNLKVLADQIQAKMMNLIDSEEVTIRRSDNWLEVEINSRILFESGEGILVNAAIPVLRRVASILAQYPNPINVEGFTDNVPINTLKYASNWELSAARAASVVHLFSKVGIEPGRMSAIAYGQYRPIAKNDTVAGRMKNRRVVIAVLSENIEIAR